jgi:membrane protein required for colicin V production
MNWADYLILATLGLSVIIGLWRGLVSEAMALICWALAFWVAWMFGEKLASRFSGIDVPSVRLMLGYALCFITVLILGALASFLMRKLVASTGLSGTDRMLGMVFGLARGLLLVVLVVTLAGFTPFPADPWWQKSRLLPEFQRGAEWLSARLPESVSRYLDYRRALGLPEAPPAPPLQPAKPAGDKPST